MSNDGLHAHFTWFSGEESLQVLILRKGEKHLGPAYVTAKSPSKDVAVTLGQEGQLLFVRVEAAQKKGPEFAELLQVVLAGGTPKDDLLARVAETVDRLIKEALDSADRSLAFGRKNPPTLKGLPFSWRDCEFNKAA